MPVLSSLSPAPVWKHFEQLCAVPRPSKREQDAAGYVVRFAQEHGLEYKQDSSGNVIIRKKAAAGMESLTPVVLQGHLDMVVQSRSGFRHDPERDPVHPRIDGEWVRAENTTLGADNGIGVSTALAVLESKDISHGPIEALFTIDEETGMTGAFKVGPGVLEGRILINLDTEQEGEICIGCAGGIDAYLDIPLEFIPVPGNYKSLKLKVNGLRGGHSGIDIHLGRGNAIKILNRILFTLHNTANVSISEFTAGSARNAIPRDAGATVLVEGSAFERCAKDIEALSKVIGEEFSVADPGVVISTAQCTLPASMLSTNSFAALTNAIYGCPNGVIRMSDRAPGVVETSNNLAIIGLTGKTASMQCLLRSLSESAKKDLVNMVDSVFTLAGASVRFEGDYPGWQPDPGSAIVRLMSRVYEDLFKRNVEIKVVHAGLECGIIGAFYPGMQLVSCGPTIRSPHSPDECLHIPSVPRFWTFLTEVLKRIPRM